MIISIKVLNMRLLSERKRTPAGHGTAGARSITKNEDGDERHLSAIIEPAAYLSSKLSGGSGDFFRQRDF